MKSFVTLLFTCLALGLTGQSNALELSVRKLFPNQAEVQWLRSFKGRMDDLTDVGIVLGFDGKVCRGKMVYLQSKAEFVLSGSLGGSQFLLNETDPKGEVSGRVEGQIASNFLQATWSNFDYTVTKKLILKEVGYLDYSPTPCGDNKWIGHYESPDGEGLELLLQKSANDQAWGIVFYQNRSYRANGEVDARNRLNLTLQRSSGKPMGRLSADFSVPEGFTAILTKEDKSSQSIKLGMTRQYPVGCKEWADHVSSYDATFPTVGNAAFDTWMEKKAADWLEICRTETAKTSTAKPTPAMRAVKNAVSWCELEYLSDSLVSGFISARSSWNGGQQDAVFNFDLKKGEEIRHQDIFKEFFSPTQYVQDFVKTAFKNHALYQSDTNFQQWIESADFPHFTIRKEGICFSTAFDPFYGRQSLTVPYAELKPNLKENSVLKSLIP